MKNYFISYTYFDFSYDTGHRLFGNTTLFIDTPVNIKSIEKAIKESIGGNACDVTILFFQQLD